MRERSAAYRDDPFGPFYDDHDPDWGTEQPCRCEPWAQRWMADQPERCVNCGGSFAPRTVDARRLRPGEEPRSV